jgi:uncharacterized protein involved in outer membrane biogenesis
MIKWTGIALGLMIVGIVVLILVFDWHWIKGSVARKASAAIGHTVLLAGDLDVDRPWPSTVQMGIFDWHWIKGYVARNASAALGRTVVIEGALDVDLT